MSAQTDRLAQIARDLAVGLTPGSHVIFDGPQSSIRIWPDDQTGETRYQIKGYWPASEIADKTDDQLRVLLNSWTKLIG